MSKKNCPYISKDPWIMEFQNVFRISSRDKHVHKILNCKATFPDGSDGKDSACSAGDLSSTLGSGRPPGEGNGYPFHYSCIEIPWTQEPGGLQSMGSQRVRYDWVSDTFTFKAICLHKITNSKAVFKVSFLKYVQSKVFMVESLASVGIALAFNT